jgi:hypothetical protein
MLVVYALLAVSSAPARGAFLGLAAAAKFAPLALAPLFARGAGRVGRLWEPGLFAFWFGLVIAVPVLFYLPDGGFTELYDRTVGYQAGRDSPFSVWGQVDSLGWVQTAVKVAVVAFAVAVAFVPRRRGPVQVAALGAAVVIALEIATTHWFYLYIVWFAPLVFVALFASYRGNRHEDAPSARSAREAETPAAVPA